MQTRRRLAVKVKVSTLRCGVFINRSMVLINTRATNRKKTEVDLDEDERDAKTETVHE